MICPACNALYSPSVLVCEGCGSGLLEIPDSPLLSGKVLDDRYDVDAVVGTGGMGTVYRARQRGMEREVAIKVLHPHYAVEPRAVKRFFREAQAASRLIHPNVVTVYDFGRSYDGHLYMVMEMLEGWTLGDLIHYRSPLAPALAIAIAGQICDALDEAYKQRLVHRDLKPDNILLTQTPESGEAGVWAKVLDFGIARIIKEDGGGLEARHSTVEIAGTPAYMSPEQILGKDPDTRSDLYSLGIILFEMLTRTRPFDDETSVALCMKQLNEKPPAVSSIQPVSQALELVVASLLEKQPGDRPLRPRDVKAALRACPEASLPFAPPSMRRGDEGRSLGDRTTRAEHHPLVMLERTSDLGSVAAANVPLSEVIERFKKDALTFPRDASTSAYTKGRRPEAAKLAVEPKKARPVAAVVVVLGEHPGTLVTGEVGAWIEQRVRAPEAFRVLREDRRVTIECLGAREVVKPMIELCVALQERALAQNVALRVGVALVSEAEGHAAGVDLARRLAVATTHGQVALASVAARVLGVDVRPQTTVFMPDGSPLDCAVVRRARGSASGGASVGVTGEDVESGSGLLWGRGLQLRRLGQICDLSCDRSGDDPRRAGPATALIVGPRGMGKTAVLSAFLQGRNALCVRVSPLAAAHPGHTIARLCAMALGIQSLRGRPSDLDALVEIDLGDRERELIELMLLDRPAIEAPTPRALARVVVDALARKAGDGPLVVALDDVHLVDRASREVLQLVVELSRGKPWCFVATARWVKPDTFLGNETRVDLRALGLRAMNQLAEELRIPPRQRHGLLAAAQGNPLSLRLAAKIVGDGVVPATLQSGDGPVPWLLSCVLRGADPQQAERAWLAAALGEGPLVEEPATQAARLYLEQSLPKEIAQWLAERLPREGQIAAELGQSVREPSIHDAGRRAERTSRLGLHRLAALELEAALALVPAAERAGRELEIANLRARAGDVNGAVQAFDASSQAVERMGGERRPTALLRFARTLLDLGEQERAHEALSAAETIVRNQEGGANNRPQTVGEWLVLCGRAAMLRGDYASAAMALQRGKEVAEAFARTDARASRGLMALVQEVRAELAVSMGDAESARTNFRQARDTFRDLGQQTEALRCLVALGEVELQVLDLKRASDTLRAASRLAAAAGLVREELRAEIALGESELLLAGIDDGSTRLRAAFKRVAVENEDEALQGRAALGMAHAMAARRLWIEVFRYSERARAGSRSPAIIARALLVEAEAHLGQEQPRKAKLALEHALEAARAAADGLLMARVRERVAALDPAAAAA